MEGKITIDRNEAGDVYLTVENSYSNVMTVLHPGEGHAVMSPEEAENVIMDILNTLRHIKRSSIAPETLTHQEG